MPSCADNGFSPLPPPTFKDDADAGDVAGAVAVWGKENVNRARKRDGCEARVRAQFAKGGQR